MKYEIVEIEEIDGQEFETVLETGHFLVTVQTPESVSVQSSINSTLYNSILENSVLLSPDTPETGFPISEEPEIAEFSGDSSWCRAKEMQDKQQQERLQEQLFQDNLQRQQEQEGEWKEDLMDKIEEDDRRRHEEWRREYLENRDR